MGAYADAYQRSSSDPEGFWLDAADAIDWERSPSRALDDSRAPLYRWFPDGVLNTCFNALDRHVRDGRGEQDALVWDSAMTGTVSRWTYRELLERVSVFAGALRAQGVERGDRVVIYLPMVPEAAVAMLACARIGAVHSVVFGGFAPRELAARVDDARPKVIVAASCGLEPNRVVEYKPIVDEALRLSEHRPDRVIVLQREQATAALGERDLDWDDAVAGAEPADCVPVAATDPLYVLYTSGTTGRPKGVVRDNGGHAVALRWSMSAIYDIGPGEVFWTASDVGWVVGHSYIVYGPLLAGATTIVYEGKPVGTPDSGAFWRVIAEHGVKSLFTAPTAFRAIKRVDPDAVELAKHDISSLRSLFLAGERLDPETYQWAVGKLGIPVVDHWWQTETGWPICANPRGLEPMPVKPGSPTVPVPGYQVEILDQSGEPVPTGRDGAICIRLPLPPGTLPTLWNADDRFRGEYLERYPGYYLTGDSGHVDEDGYVFVMGRTDDVINVAGHRLSTGSMEAVLAEHPAVAECAVIGVRDALKGQVPRGFVVLKAGVEVDEEKLRGELVAAVRDQIGPVAAFRDVSVVDGLPKTRSGKILRKSMREIADTGQTKVPSTIEDPAVLDALRPALRPGG
ncbi:propionyl-CoA synthetase [Saccharopolyspora erythraea NRRL 2338]|uniref:AMP-dependent synthetase and ligase n=2 Tax=Saccharopolyspora erythraea TaxID=1836 RepID=A4FGE4_SACEN|nr:propionyl-CoA synthetase [Saccharopolyspora erythraea]EQD84894.1 acetyl-CoA synthetase [Saccharopolyspora erythraea D]PFG96824.1 propionyl-CoA synthetase [Saccharopolyspora erythraea NRRL 2338]QRK87063.1 propionyl-CoA synthetase [Saccharopolyspora erythraea]CAM03119.1 AMP-dependent synthetase and ligase [Saccharopolyspora erythraea NRRL 2338]